VGAWAWVWCGRVGVWQKAKKIREKNRAFKVPPYRENDRLPWPSVLRILYYYPEPQYI